ncbi:hypothetical protein VP01_1037g15 [Puccinia sorghi]|uniref:Uncharacterized protein n=1 Tax=Puccinia sorghi TaxID=27349 RepID=A0A0L6VUQ4_9BASI|nr:hypothetical protein VP01_1037g15 [Puccinia sorghi]
MEYLSKQQWFLFMQDAWTMLNVTAFLAITTHFVHGSFQMTDFTIAVPHIQDNTSTNSQMGREIELMISLFPAKTHYLGCIAHLINLGAKAGLAVLGSVHDMDNCDVPNGKNNQSHGSSIMSISYLTSSPNGLSLNLKTIVKRIQGLCTYVCFSPQRRKQFKAVVDFAQPNLCELGYNFTVLDIDVNLATTSLSSILIFRHGGTQPST